MSRDLERQLDEMGPTYREVVARLRAGSAAQSAGTVGGRKGPTAVWAISRPCRLVAASLAALVALVVVFVQAPKRTGERASHSPAAPREYVMSVDEMIATQKPDGGWQNDFITRRNAEALRTSALPDAAVAYKKAMRNLRLRGRLHGGLSLRK